jgi:HSP20 family protein
MRNEVDFWKPNLAWRPTSLFGELQRTMDRALNGVLDDFPTGTSSLRGLSFEPSAEIEETDSYYLAKFDLPGIPKDDVKIELNDNTIRISGERRDERTEKKGSTRLQETRYGRFERVFVLPTKVDEKKIETSYDNGVLNIYLPKLEAAKAIEIKVGDNKGFFKNLIGKRQERDSDRMSMSTQH